ncbi:hypothetical protein SmJEL517_g05188 [Synchytrium microbalum]|uniref:3-beta hydroxysteroid dehydrogenase/isomerase domain-containing protein n=1 Tax=Synchytrium microbalum TaxID=1806994 RepID=A0A507C087_9FUNG|nr:uncharacterized protein SmJEL517_g05188 [Synchytrium microbalum]TPX31474.1 hypothetical protein SmJEL517_g05188 [Synchytrium microbalum]
MDSSSLKYIALGIGAATTATALSLHLYNKSLFAVTIVPRPLDKDCFALPPREDFIKLLGAPTNVGYAVTGGAGFIGAYIVEQLLARGEKHVYVLDLKPSNNIPKGTQFVECDITDYGSVKKALDNRSIQVVYHVAAIIRFMDEFPEQLPVSMKVNVKGTENVIEACRELSIPILVQTSTSHVCVGKDLNPIFYGNENLPYTTKPFNNYAKTKALAEQATLAANGTALSNGGVLSTGSIRPTSTIYGRGDRWGLDTYFSTGKLTIHHPGVVDDFCYVENLALAHLLLERALREKPKESGGKAYFISHDDPLSRENFFAILEKLLPNRFSRETMPYPLMYVLSRLATFTSRYTSTSLGDLDMFTACSDRMQWSQHCFSSQRARKVLGYEPFYSVEQGVAVSWNRFQEGKK